MYKIISERRSTDGRIRLSKTETEPSNEESTCGIESVISEKDLLKV